MNTAKKRYAWLPYLAAPAIYLAISIFYFAPQYAGKTLPMHDLQQYIGMSADIERHVEEYGEDPQWTGSSFSGMPSYMIDFKVDNWLIRHASRIPARIMGEPAVLTFLAMMFFWLMSLLWRKNPWVGIVPSLGYGFSTYTLLIIGAGHISKVWAMAFAPLLVGAIIYTYRSDSTRKLWFGGALAALAASMLISANHPQITYYFLLVILALVVNETVKAARRRSFGRLGRATAVLALAAVLAVGSNFALLYYTAQHTGDTTRGGSELVSDDRIEVGGKGLDLEYATAWSYGKGESFNIFIPNFKGGASDRGFSADGEVAKSLVPYGARNMAGQLPAYWGDQPYTAGPTYIGASVLFLAILGLFLLEGRRKWWLFAVSLFALFLSWGNNMMWFTELSFKILPAYNKFRAVSTALVIVQWTMPVLAMLIIGDLWQAKVDRERLTKGLMWTAGITGGLALFFALFGGGLFPFSAPVDSQLPAEVTQAMRGERASMLKGDAWRSLLFVLLAGGAVAMYGYGKIRRGVLVGALAVIVCLDLVSVGRRYLSWDSFVPRKANDITATNADRQILADKEPGYRVANFSVSTFNDATTSYFHRSVGGYHGAKLRRYQDIIDYHLGMQNMEVYNMLNTKYFIVPGQDGGEPAAMVNKDAYGAAWFVDEVVLADSPNQEIEALYDMDARFTAVVDRRFEDRLGGHTGILTAPDDDPVGADDYIELEDYKVNHLTYRYSAAEDRVAVFSEIYYDKGWTAYIDGVEAPYFRADYILRAMALPAGEHTVEFRFAAPGFAMASGITLACSLIILAGFAVSAGFVWLRRSRRESEAL